MLYLQWPELQTQVRGSVGMLHSRTLLTVSSTPAYCVYRTKVKPSHLPHSSHLLNSHAKYSGRKILISKLKTCNLSWYLQLGTLCQDLSRGNSSNFYHFVVSELSPSHSCLLVLLSYLGWQNFPKLHFYDTTPPLCPSSVIIYSPSKGNRRCLGH